MYSILAELVEDEINCKEKRKEENEKKAYVKEIATLQQSLDQTKELHGVEAIMVDALGNLLNDMEKDYD